MAWGNCWLLGNWATVLGGIGGCSIHCKALPAQSGHLQGPSQVRFQEHFQFHPEGLDVDEGLRAIVPRLFRFVHSAYYSPSTLFLENKTI